MFNIKEDLKNNRVEITDFIKDQNNNIKKGHFGKVERMKYKDNKYYAIKTILKLNMIEKKKYSERE